MFMLYCLCINLDFKLKFDLFLLVFDPLDNFAQYSELLNFLLINSYIESEHPVTNFPSYNFKV